VGELRLVFELFDMDVFFVIPVLMTLIPSVYFGMNGCIMVVTNHCKLMYTCVDFLFVLWCFGRLLLADFTCLPSPFSIVFGTLWLVLLILLYVLGGGGFFWMLGLILFTAVSTTPLSDFFRLSLVGILILLLMTRMVVVGRQAGPSIDLMCIVAGAAMVFVWFTSLPVFITIMMPVLPILFFIGLLL
jgi:hypothetical protein